MGLWVERLFPAIAAAVGGAIWHYLGVKLPGDEKEFLAAALSLGAVLTGFVATGQAILMALPSDSVMGQIRTSGYLPILTSYIAQALNGTLGFCLINVVGFFLLRDTPDRLSQYYSTAWLVSGLFATLSFHRVTSILMKIMRH